MACFKLIIEILEEIKTFKEKCNEFSFNQQIKEGILSSINKANYEDAESFNY